MASAEYPVNVPTSTARLAFRIFASWVKNAACSGAISMPACCG